MTVQSPRGNGSVPDGCPAAHIALAKADHAESMAESAESGLRVVHDHLANLTRQVKGWRSEMREGFRQLGARVQAVQDVASETAEDVEDTKVRNLKRELAQLKGQRKWWLGIVAAVVAGVVTALIVALVHR